MPNLINKIIKSELATQFDESEGLVLVSLSGLTATLSGNAYALSHTRTANDPGTGARHWYLDGPTDQRVAASLQDLGVLLVAVGDDPTFGDHQPFEGRLGEQP